MLKNVLSSELSFTFAYSALLCSAGTAYKPRDSWVCGICEFAKSGTSEISEKGL